jgi:polyphosphate kinase 2
VLPALERTGSGIPDVLRHSGGDEEDDMKRSAYEKELRKLQVELCHLQDWVKEKQVRVIIVFEGRDGAGKGGTIKAITERVSPRVFRTVALPAPSDRQKTQIYMQRYLEHFPAGGEIVIFDRSWYNRAGVERVMGFCSDKEYERFLRLCPIVERFLVDGGTTLIKLWLEVTNPEQQRRFEARIKDPLRQWKLSPMDLPSRERWYDYSLARDRMLEATDTEIAPWYIVKSDDKRTARLNAIAHILSQIPYKKSGNKKVTLPNRSKKHAYNDEKTLEGRRFVKERFQADAS